MLTDRWSKIITLKTWLSVNLGLTHRTSLCRLFHFSYKRSSSWRGVERANLPYRKLDMSCIFHMKVWSLQMPSHWCSSFSGFCCWVLSWSYYISLYNKEIDSSIYNAEEHTQGPPFCFSTATELGTHLVKSISYPFGFIIELDHFWFSIFNNCWLSVHKR